MPHAAGKATYWGVFRKRSMASFRVYAYPMRRPGFPFCLALLAMSLFSAPAGGEIQLTSPEPRAVFQRDETGVARVDVAGVTDTPGLRRVEVRAVPMTGFAGTDGDWVPVHGVVSGKTFATRLVLPGGWYEVQARSVTAGGAIEQVSVERVGVGEVFITTGQSNATNSGKPPLTPRDDRVSASGKAHWQHAADPQPMANGHGGTPWPVLGDLLIDEWDVPVGFISVGAGGMRVDRWHAGSRLYARLHDALERVAPNGARAILWHQGEADNTAGTTTQEYARRLQDVIARSRADAGFSIPWGIALASYQPKAASPVAPRITRAQRTVIAEDPLVFEGPATDALRGPSWRHDGVHFNESGLREHARQWAEKIETFFDLSDRPRAVLNLGNSAVEDGREIELSAAASVAEDGHRVVSFEWDFGDGLSADGETVAHVYAAPGRYTVRLTVTDSRGIEGRTEKDIVVNMNMLPWL